MDSIIKRSDFCHNDEEKREQFESLMSDWRGENGEKAKVKDVTSALNALVEKVGGAKRPEHETEGYRQGMEALDTVTRLAGDVTDQDESSTPALQKAFLAFCNQLLQCGPSTLIADMVYETLRDGNISLEDYMETVDKSSIESLLKSLRVEAKPEKGASLSNVWSRFDDVWTKTLKNIESNPHASELKPQLLDYAAELKFACVFQDKETCKNMNEVAKTILSHLDDPFETTEEYERVRGYLKRCGEVVTRPDFAPHSEGADVLQRFLKIMVNEMGNRGLVKEFHATILELAVQVTKCKYNEKDFVNELFDDVIRFFRKIPKESLESLKSDTSLFTEMAKKYTTAIENLDIVFLQRNSFARDVMGDAIEKIYDQNKSVSKQWVALALTLYKRPTYDTMRACRTVVDNDKGWNWKENSETLSNILQCWLNLELPKDPKDDKEENAIKEFMEAYKSVGTNILRGLKKFKLAKNYTKIMLDIVLHYIMSDNKVLCDFAEDVAEHIEVNPKTDKAAVVTTIAKLHEEIKKEEREWNSNWDLQRAAEDLIESCFKPFKDGKVFSDDDLAVFLSVCETCLAQDPIDPDTGRCPNAYFCIFLKIMGSLASWLPALGKTHLAKNLLPGLVRCLDVDDEEATTLAGVQLQVLLQGENFCKAASTHLDVLLKTYMDTGNSHLNEPIKKMYPHNTAAIKEYFPALMESIIDTGDPEVIYSIAGILELVAIHQPEMFSESDTESLIIKARNQAQQHHQFSLMQILQELSKRRPKMVAKKSNLFLDVSKWNNTPVFFSALGILGTLSLHDEKLAPDVINMCLKTSKTSQDKSVQIVSLNTARTIGFRYPQIIKPKRAEVDSIPTSDPDVLQMKQMLIDMVDGKTPEDVQKQLLDQQKEVLSLADRVGDVEKGVGNLQENAARQDQQINDVSAGLKTQAGRVGKVETALEETAAKVEEIDQKTLSHAPFWSRDVSRLLNVTSDTDWRLLSSRLGYTNDDIRAWAQQADPCMAMLNEWYATRKTREATFGILTQLQEMNRSDACAIVENAMKNTEKVVEDEEFEYATPPAIFISYQWGHQPEVQLLQRHLEMAGFSCWLDMGQMGGGDKLFEKIDSGIRAAQVVISCVTEKYAKSPNCNREVNLSVNLNKPMIPLLLEKCTWPPPGSMGPIFSEYLFIRFFQRAGEETTDDRYWPQDKFLELLMQLSGLGLAPDQTAIQPQYRDWWMPVVKSIKIDKSKTKNGGKPSGTNQAVAATTPDSAPTSPDVFISYQWGRQKDIIQLYERLTELGFSCWLDIKQMGGGDSLFDKIDRGIRGCKVVVSCVTQKYALSTNCRREVGLAAALDKPLLPLLLESGAWPPQGPMGVIMSQLLYIDFSKPAANENMWQGASYYGLLSKLRSFVPKNAAPVSEDIKEKQPSAVSRTQNSTKKPVAQMNQPNRKAPTDPMTVNKVAEKPQQGKAVPIGRRPSNTTPTAAANSNRPGATRNTPPANNSNHTGAPNNTPPASISNRPGVPRNTPPATNTIRPGASTNTSRPGAQRNSTQANSSTRTGPTNNTGTKPRTPKQQNANAQGPQQATTNQKRLSISSKPLVQPATRSSGASPVTTNSPLKPHARPAAGRTNSYPPKPAPNTQSRFPPINNNKK